MNDGVQMLGAIAVPLAGAGVIALCHRRPNVRESVTIITALLLLMAVISTVPSVFAGGSPRIELFDLLPGLPVAFQLEPLGLLFALVASSLWIVNSLYSIGYMRANKEGRQTRFYVCFALALGCTMGIAFSGNVLTLFIFYEALTLVTYPLVTHHGTDDARNGGRTYLGYLVGTSILFFLPALIFTWHLAGTTDFRAGGILPGSTDIAVVSFLLALYLFGIGKAALMPVHRWLPAAMVAPTPVSALLHAVAVVKAGVFCVVKVVIYVFGVDALTGASDWLVVLSGFTIVAASVIALRSDNLKRRLAYSTVSQLSYVIMATAVLAPLSIIAAALHIAAHALGKITLFFAAGSIYTAAHKTEVSQLNGIGRRMPWTSAAFTIGAFSLIGIPPAAGFVTKWYMLMGAVSAGSAFAVVVLVASTLLNAAYFLPIVHAAYFREPPENEHPHGEAPALMIAAMALTSAATLVFFFVSDYPLMLAKPLLEAGGIR